MYERREVNGGFLKKEEREKKRIERKKEREKNSNLSLLLQKRSHNQFQFIISSFPEQ